MNDTSLHESAALAGTPCYVFDINALQRRVQFLRAHLPQTTKICYAMKANTFVLKEISPLVDRIEICSPGEFRIAQRLEPAHSKYVISGVYKDPDFIHEIIAAGSESMLFTVESACQLSALLHEAKMARRRISVLLRLTSGNQFGMDEETLEQILCSHMNNPWLDIRGIQYFSGTQKHSVKRLKKEIGYLDDLLLRFSIHYGALKELEFGPGLPVAYFQGEDCDELSYLRAFSEMLNGMRFAGNVTLEIGRSLVADCGNYLTKVSDVKTSYGEHYAIVDGGIHQLVYYGQSMAMHRPSCRVLPPTCTGSINEWSIFGSLCTANDVLVKRMPMNQLRIGDTLVFENAGAYCMTEGISMFLSRDLPAVVLIHEDGVLECVRPITAIDTLNTPDYSKRNEVKLYATVNSNFRGN